MPPPEARLVINTSGGTFWEAFRKAYLDPFEKECGVRVSVIVSSGHSFPQLREYVKRNAVPYDISYTGVPWELEQGIREGLFEKLPPGFWDAARPNLIDGSYNDYGTWLSAYSEVLIYSTRVFPSGMASWADLWDVAKYPGARTLYDHPYTLIVALLADGVAPDRLYPISDERLRQAFRKLNVLAPHVRAYWVTGDEPVVGVQRGDFVAGIAQSGRVVAGLRRGLAVGMRWEQHILSSAWLFRPRGAAHPNAAALFLRYMSDARRQADFARLIGYGAGARDTERHLAPDESRNLTTAKANLAKAVKIDPDWWRDNGARVQSLWKEWRATGKVPL
ncbi:extracellular solute-binding protein [Zoogloea sp. LCSB751]|uniref:extracellular solute-binding protein n=1 Tax=Zoogloea sp. LCSB751 TaxID=1965277 RepID=UPI00137473E1|nr:extracellular solute-binding protein [Zoogloea sp. LCSB751]